MATVVHPVFPDQKKVVPDDEAQSWLDLGWTKAKKADEVDETTVLSSFEQALLDQKAGVVDDVPSYQPTLTNTDLKEA